MNRKFRYLLDTNVISDLIRSPHGTVAQRIEEVGEDTVCTSVIVAGELRYGAEKSRSAKLVERVDLLLAAITVLALEPPADRRYGELRATLSRRGLPIGPNDLLIAAHAIAEGLTLVTANTREFRRVPNLGVENWRQP